MKATQVHFRCDLCGRYSNFGVTESYVRDPSNESLVAQSTVCVRCISNATALLLEGICNAASSTDDDPTSTGGSSSE